MVKTVTGAFGIALTRLWLCLLLILNVCSIQAHSQNLVPNPSFEDTLLCPNFVSQIDYATGWHTSVNTPDYYNACNNNGSVNPGIVGVPSSARGYQPARTGNAFAGEVIYWTQQPDYRETFYAQLLAPLSPGVTYNAGMHVILNEDNAMWAVDGGLGIYLSTTPINPLTPFIYNPQVVNVPGNVLNDSLNWTEISGTFTAAGGEEYIAIGSFIRDTALTIVNRGGTHPFTSYAIEDVWVIPDSLMTGKEDILADVEIQIRPNPSNGQFSVWISQDEYNKAYFLIEDLQGRRISEGSIKLKAGITNSPLQLNTGSGIYILKLVAGSSSISRKIIIG